MLLSFVVGPAMIMATASAAQVHSRPHHGRTAKSHATTPPSAATHPAAPVRSQAPPRKRSVKGGSESMEVTATRRTVSQNSETTIGIRELTQQVSGQNVLKAVGQLPGVSYSSTDPLGVDTWGASVYMRGFFMDQLAMSLDGVPLNDQTYDNPNGLNINNAWMSEDITRVSVSQGGGALDQSSNTNLGGSMQFFTSDPRTRAGATVSQGFGSYAMKRTYVRLDSGEFNSTGTRFYVAYGRSYEKKFDSSTPGFMQSVNAKLVQPIREQSKMTAFFSWNDAEVYGYSDRTLGQYKLNGWRTEWLAPNYPLAFKYAEGNYPANWNNLQSGSYTQIYDGGQSTTDYLGGLNFDITLTDRLKWRTILYAHRDMSFGTYNAPGICSPGTSAAGTCPADGSGNYNYVSGQVPLSEEVWPTQQMREGFVTSLDYKLHRHDISAGIWYQHNVYSLSNQYYNEPQLGQGEPVPTVGPYDIYGKAFATAWTYAYHTNSFQFHVQDRWRILDTLTATYGFKSILQQTAGGNTYYNSNSDYSAQTNQGPYGSITVGEGFLPAVNLDWHFLPRHELYFDFAENYRPFIGGAHGSASPWGVQNQQLFNEFKKNTAPERTFTYVLGYRYTSHFLTAGIDGYHVDDHNRLLSLSSGSIGSGASGATTLNTHRATMWGMDAVATIVPFHGLSFTNSVSYNHFVYDSNAQLCWGDTVDPDGNPIAAGCGSLKGKKLTGYPSVMYKMNLTYSWRHASTWLDVNYYSKRPFTQMNDLYVPSYWLANLGASYVFGDVGPLKGVKATFMVYNLFNAKYIAMMGENGFAAIGDYQSTERGSPREYFGTIKASY
ncbi:TonB-dependent receptor [Acidomonas methanolica]|uniref:TonB-dependent receptor n=1 Tax=Acidomonas methanolica TaxID=437 RepID=UPI002119FDA1|nr:TonB-dependent receptor [Acidomonas methanolica]